MRSADLFKEPAGAALLQTLDPSHLALISYFYVGQIIEDPRWLGTSVCLNSRVLATLLAQPRDAYGVTIRDRIEEHSGRKVSIGRSTSVRTPGAQRVRVVLVGKADRRTRRAAKAALQDRSCGRAGRPSFRSPASSFRCTGAGLELAPLRNTFRQKGNIHASSCVAAKYRPCAGQLPGARPRRADRSRSCLGTSIWHGRPRLIADERSA